MKVFITISTPITQPKTLTFFDIAEVTETQDADLKDKEDNIEDEKMITKPTTKEVLKAVSVLDDFNLFSRNAGFFEVLE